MLIFNYEELFELLSIRVAHSPTLNIDIYDMLLTVGNLIFNIDAYKMQFPLK